MARRLAFVSLFLISFIHFGHAQSKLPDITVKNIGGKIIISWINAYQQNISNISIQRSFDSLKNYNSIGSVLNPLNNENGFADNKPPYNKMYYRLFIAFEGGQYLFSQIARPVKEKLEVEPTNPEDPKPDVSFIYKPYEKILTRDSAGIKVPVTTPKKNVGILNPKTGLPEIINPKIITYPSKRIFTSKTNTIVINLPEASVKNYSIKFFTEDDQPVFELKKITSDYLILEKVNFEKSGWYNFEVYDNGKLIEKNKFFVPKDGKGHSNSKEKVNK